MFTIPPPKDWQTFEALCKDIWSEILSDKNIQLNGRSGQAQHGVDIFGTDRIEGKNYGIQCKQKSYSQKLTIDEIQSEVNKAQNFSPKLDVYILATTAFKDQNIETYAREISRQNNNNGKFSVYVYGWGDIEAKLNVHQDILMKYYQRLLDPKTPNDIYFNFWYKEAKIEKLFYYACSLPFRSFNIRYSYLYLEMLSGYLNKHDVFLANTNANLSDNYLKEHVMVFNHVALELIDLIGEYQPKEDMSSSGSDITYTYWVECSHLAYVEQGEFIENKKKEVRDCFYKLIQSANKIVSIWNMELNSNQQIMLTEFVQPNPNFPLFGSLFLIQPHYPMYEN